MELTELDSMFIREFCNATGKPEIELSRIKVTDRWRTGKGFFTELDPNTVPAELCFDERVYGGSLKVALVGPDRVKCGMVLFFDESTGLLDTIEGHTWGDDPWPSVETPARWS